MEEALKIMCDRCNQHEVCGGTGCQPKKDILTIFKDCKNELCLICGAFMENHETHECDKCRWSE